MKSTADPSGAPASATPAKRAPEPISAFDIFKIGIGPSSSHTMGPWVACRQHVQRLADMNRLTEVTHVAITLYGSLAKTGKGHGTDKALLLGLRGEDPETIPVKAVETRVETIRDLKQIALNDTHTVAFDPDDDLVFKRNETRPYHANALTIHTTFDDDTTTDDTYYSVGGGFVVHESDTENEDEQTYDVTLPYPCGTGNDLKDHCEHNGYSVSELVRRNERVWRSDAEIDARLLEIWDVMKRCMYRGCHTTGTLPGGLDVSRRAARMHDALIDAHEDMPSYDGASSWIEAIRTNDDRFQTILKWVSAFAIAVNEENASFGRVVTAPTNGAAGVIPAVLMYYLCFSGGTRDDVPRFLLTAAQIGSLFKQGATISAAMGGCQAEIGVSSAMASAALTECSGGGVEQTLMAAEIAMEHHLGLTCDPVGGLVQVPCIERNSMGAIKAITASNIALESDPAQAKVPLDTAIQSMWETARDMSSKYKETSEGGLAAQIPVNVTEC